MRVGVWKNVEGCTWLRRLSPLAIKITKVSSKDLLEANSTPI